MKKSSLQTRLILEIIEEAVSLIKKFPSDLTVLREQSIIIDTKIKELTAIAKGE